MRQIYNTAKIQVRSQENLNIEIYGLLLIPVLLLKLSSKLSLIIKRQLDKKAVGKKNISQNIRMGKVIYTAITFISSLNYHLFFDSESQLSYVSPSIF